MPSIALSDASGLSAAPNYLVPFAQVAQTIRAVPAALAVPQIDAKKSAEARRLFELEQLDVSWEQPTGALWTFMRPRGRPSYNLDILQDFHAWQHCISTVFTDRPEDLRYLVIGSRTPGVFNLGGDLDYFLAKIRERDRQALVAYGESCVRILHRNLNGLGLPMTTIGLGAGRRPRRRLRVAAVVQRHHCRTWREVRFSREPLRPFSRHGRLQSAGATARRGAR